MTETITVRGFLGGDVRLVTTDRGLPIATFRLASTPRRFDRERQTWVDGETNWYSVACFRSLAQNAHATLGKGDPVVVTGRLKVRRWENEHGQRGTAVDIDADGVGHDLTFGTGSFVRLGTGPGEGVRGGAAQGSGEGPGESVDEGGDEYSGEGTAAAVGGTGADGASGDSAAASAWDAAPAGEREPAPF
ncbi:single-stranded DNA-binding protein [Nesterenkonia sp. F]|uniref:single-stranded DNA-binding protein n=1 Tax=Nesterenkonia sp. F TaxID=795955 RepID=UPI000255CD19|nr:single-stranded DNA-binding protein [Nesterenkonia sp. F]